MALLDLKHVSKAYPHSKGVLPVLADVSFTVEQGEFIAIVGPSGCGKSTMVRIINGIVPATSGQVLYNGRQVDGINLECALVFQSFALLPWMTVKANVEMGLEARGVSPEERERIAGIYIDKVGLDGFEEAYPRELVGRHEAASRFRARARGRAQSSADGRAVFRARCIDGDHAARGTPRYLAFAGHVGAYAGDRHPHHRGGGGARRSHHRDVVASGTHRGGYQAWRFRARATGAPTCSICWSTRSSR